MILISFDPQQPEPGHHPRLFRNGVHLPRVASVTLLPGNMCRVLQYVDPPAIVSTDHGEEVAAYRVSVGREP